MRRKPFGWTSRRERILYFMAVGLMVFYQLGFVAYPRWEKWRKDKLVSAAVLREQNTRTMPLTRVVQFKNNPKGPRFQVNFALKPTFNEVPELTWTRDGWALSFGDRQRQMQVFIRASDEEHFGGHSISLCRSTRVEQKTQNTALLIENQNDVRRAGPDPLCGGLLSYLVSFDQRWPELNGMITSCDALGPATTPLGEKVIDELLTACQSVKIKRLLEL